MGDATDLVRYHLERAELAARAQGVRWIWLTPTAFTVVDAEDYEWLMGLGVWVMAGKYAAVKVAGVWYYMADCLMGVAGYTDTLAVLVDHINPGNPLDNTRKNLRLATRSQNAANVRRKASRSTCAAKSLYRLVTWRLKDGKYRYKARCKVQTSQAGEPLRRISIELGYYDSEGMAALAADLLISTMYGSFGRLNFPDLADWYANHPDEVLAVLERNRAPKRRRRGRNRRPLKLPSGKHSAAPVLNWDRVQGYQEPQGEVLAQNTATDSTNGAETQPRGCQRPSCGSPELDQSEENVCEGPESTKTYQG